MFLAKFDRLDAGLIDIFLLKGRTVLWFLEETILWGFSFSADVAFLSGFIASVTLSLILASDLLDVSILLIRAFYYSNGVWWNKVSTEKRVSFFTFVVGTKPSIFILLA